MLTVCTARRACAAILVRVLLSCVSHIIIVALVIILGGLSRRDRNSYANKCRRCSGITVSIKQKRAMLFTSQREQIRFRDERLHRVRAKLPKVHSNSCAPLRIGNYKQSSQYVLHHLLSRGVFHLNMMIVMNCSLKKFNKIR